MNLNNPQNQRQATQNQPAAMHQGTNLPHDVLAYDGQCGFCSTSARRWRRLLGRINVETAPVQLPEVRHALGLQEGETAGEMVLICRDGQRFGGIDAYTELLSRFRWLRPLAIILRWPVFDELARALYRFIAAHRHQFSRWLNLKPDITENDTKSKHKLSKAEQHHPGQDTWLWKGSH